jgi:multiple sugar transport system substrate-binding protein
MVLPIKFTARMTEMINDWAEAAGAPGQIDWRTGEYQYDTQPYVEVMNFILDLQDSNSLYPGSASIDARNARARWAGGNIGMFPDGPWNPGVLQGSYEQALDFTGVSWLPVPDRSGPNIGSIYVPPPDASFFLTNDSDNPEIAAEFFLGLTTDEYYTGLAQGMDQPPLKMSAIEEVDVHDSYKNAIAQYRENVLVQPVPEAANPNVAQVVAEMRDIHPNLGEIAQGLFSGAITDVEGALEEYNRKMTEERQRAINKLQEEGVDVSIDDWVFPNWDPTKNFTPSMYE